MITMTIPKLETRFEPEVLKANKKNEATMYLTVTSDGNQQHYWCECDINVNHPLSLAPDKELGLGRTRVGILRPNKRIEKQVKVYTRPNNFPDNYSVKITVYLYDEDGAIAQRFEQNEIIKCET